MFYHNIDPILLSLGPFQIRWYGIIFVLGILTSYFVFKHLAKLNKLPLSGKDFDHYMLYGTIGLVVGARLGSVISNIGDHAANPLQIFAIWNGGMAFHGGLVGLIVAGILFSRKKKIPFYSVADLTVIPAALALAFGRIANFINGEFHGTPTSLPWSVVFPMVDDKPRHPVQLYESAKNFFTFSILWMIKGKAFPPGTLFWLFITLYGGARFALEFYKDLSPLLAGLTWGQIWSLPMLAVGSYMLYHINFKRKPAIESNKA